MKEQIEEMAKDLQETHDYEGCEAWNCSGCQYEEYGKNYFCSSIKQAEKMTAKGYSKQKWISVEDRLPENETEVLVYHGSAYNPVCNVYVYLGCNEWMDSYSNKGYTKDEQITHWMPLPEPPKGE